MKFKMSQMLGLIAFMISTMSQANAADSVATVLAKKGEVSIVSNDKITPAKRKDALIEKDRLVTAKGAKASVKFNDGTTTTLGGDTEMLISGYKWSDGDKTPTAEFELVKGVFRTVTGLVTKVSNPSFTVKTPLGSIGIRGTDFWGGYLDEDTIDVLFVGGEHEIVVTNEFGTTILTTPGQGTTIKPGKAPSAAKVWPQHKVERAVKTITF